jgi:hypothetical protein
MFRFAVDRDRVLSEDEIRTLYHNPNAAHPMHPAMLPEAAHHWLREDGQLESRVPEWQPFASVTRIFVRE